MLAIGLGKQRGAETIHARGLRETIPLAASVALEQRQGRARAGLVENAYHQLHTVRAVPAGRVPRRRPRAPGLANSLLPRVPFDAA